jgi:chromosomal replication initiation ATPase DnaA
MQEKTIEELCAKYDVEKCLIQSSRRGKELVNKRILIAKELRTDGRSFPEIGRMMHRHHTSIMNLLKKS